MRIPVLVDAGPIVAFLDKREPHHAWAQQQFSTLPLPLLTCEPAIAEAAHLTARGGNSLDNLFELITSGTVIPYFDLRRHAAALQSIIAQYRNVPMDLADACLMLMSETYQPCKILTLDSDFFVYRTQAGKALEVIAPN